MTPADMTALTISQLNAHAEFATQHLQALYRNQEV